MNIFSGAEYHLKAEDRLTNSFLWVLEVFGPSLLKHLFTQIMASTEDIEILSITSQQSYSAAGSRPDGRIETDTQTILIENKIFSPIDQEQLLRHLKGLSQYEKKPSVLVCISARESDIRKMRARNLDSIFFISWQNIIWSLGEFVAKGKIENKIKADFEDYAIEACGITTKKEVCMDNIYDDVKKYSEMMGQIKAYREKLQDAIKQIERQIGPHANVAPTPLDLTETRVTKWELIFGLMFKHKKHKKISFGIEADIHGTGYLGFFSRDIQFCKSIAEKYPDRGYYIGNDGVFRDLKPEEALSMLNGQLLPPLLEECQKNVAILDAYGT